MVVPFHSSVKTPLYLSITVLDTFSLHATTRSVVTRVLDGLDEGLPPLSSDDGDCWRSGPIRLSSTEAVAYNPRPQLGAARTADSRSQVGQGDIAMKRPWFFVAGLLLLTSLGGCKSTAGPSWLHPGSASVQQNRALRYDPYPENESGPAMVGARPREYDKPPPEPSRARWKIGNWGQ